MKLMAMAGALAGFLLVGCGPVVEDPVTLDQAQNTLKEGEVIIQAPCCSSCDSICEYYGWESTRCNSCWSYCSFSC
jgi:hypothetical protein